MPYQKFPVVNQSCKLKGSNNKHQKIKFHDLNRLKPFETLNRHTSDINSSVNIIKRDN